jgi:hypothetical protein
MDWPVGPKTKKEVKADLEIERWLEIARKRKGGNDEDVIQTAGYGDA